MRPYPELVKDLEQLVEDWFQAEYPEADWDLTTQEERIASMIANYLRSAHPEDYPRKIEEVSKAIERHAE